MPDIKVIDGYPAKLEACLETAHKMGAGWAQALPWLSSVSYKEMRVNEFGLSERVLWISKIGAAFNQLQREDFTCLRTKLIEEILHLSQDFSQPAIRNLILSQRCLPSSPEPAPLALMHIAVPFAFVLFGQSSSVQAIASSPDGRARFEYLYNRRVRLIPSQFSPSRLARTCNELFQGNDELDGLVLSGLGILTAAQDLDTAYQKLTDITSKSEAFLLQKNIPHDELVAWHQEEIEFLTPGISKIRKTISEIEGSPLLLTSAKVTMNHQGLPAKNLDFFAGKKLPYLTMYSDLGPSLVAVSDVVGKANQRHIAAAVENQPAHRLLIAENSQLLAAGNNGRELAVYQIWSKHIVQVFHMADQLGGYQEPEENSEITSAREFSHSTTHSADSGMFQGEVALVTGGASGIGKACVEALLSRGSAVVSFDINPAVHTLFADDPGYLGVVCDLTDEDAVAQAFKKLVLVFGGLDMLVLNAGIFPAGKRIDELDMGDFRKVMRINLDSNLTVMREAYPLLKNSPQNGRVVINASKNVHAPGAGATAYSSSKAALTQLGRVAILEWSKDRIRVNMVHPDAIFDTGIWTEEVLHARAAHYQMTVHEYKTRNLLRVELNSRDVGELVAEMLGPLFSKTTGAQIPIDGGSDRVI